MSQPNFNSNSLQGEPSRRDVATKLAVVAGIVVLLLGGVWLSTTASRDGDEYDPNNAMEAVSQCEDAVSQKLKAPSSATFGETVASGSGTWTVTGYVDAENSFGATVRSNFQCTVTVDGQSITRKINSLG